MAEGDRLTSCHIKDVETEGRRQAVSLRMMGWDVSDAGEARMATWELDSCCQDWGRGRYAQRRTRLGWMWPKSHFLVFIVLQCPITRNGYFFKLLSLLTLVRAYPARASWEQDTGEGWERWLKRKTMEGRDGFLSFCSIYYFCSNSYPQGSEILNQVGLRETLQQAKDKPWSHFSFMWMVLCLAKWL